MSRLAVAALTMALVLGGAAGTRAEEAKDPCAGAADDAAMRSCRDKELKDAKAELADVVAQLSKSLAEGYAEHPKVLARAQKDWARFMASECTFTQFESLQGTMGDVYETVCRTEMTRERIAKLKEILDSP